jgi:The Golgi pH Regulator (GPHR) family protein
MREVSQAKERPIGVTILAILAGIAAVLAAIHALQFLGILRITSREIVPAGRISPAISTRICSRHYRSLLLSAAFLAAGKDSSWSLGGYDFS